MEITPLLERRQLPFASLVHQITKLSSMAAYQTSNNTNVSTREKAIRKLISDTIQALFVPLVSLQSTKSLGLELTLSIGIDNQEFQCLLEVRAKILQFGPILNRFPL